MATRRPKVPRADALGQSPQKKPDGGHVIRADFGESRKAALAQQEAPAHAGSKTASTAKPESSIESKPKSASRANPGKEKPAGPVPAKAFSGRMLALAVVMVAITIMLAPTVKIFLEKKAEISALEADIASKQAEQAALKKQITRWQDPNYVKQQARDSINMVMPGEAGYWVFGGGVPAGTPGGRTGSGASGSPANLPWVDGLWESIRRSATD